MQAGERKTMASAPFLELLGLRNRAGWGGVLMMITKKQRNRGGS